MLENVRIVTLCLNRTNPENVKNKLEQQIFVVLTAFRTIFGQTEV